MLPYYRKYLITAYAVAVAVPIVITTAIAAFGGVALSSTIPGIFASLGILIVATLVMLRVMGNKAERDTAETLALYNNECNPAAFIERAQPVVANIRPPYEPMGAWFISYYAMALADVGRFDEAADIGTALQQSAAVARNDSSRSALLVALEPLVLRLFGPQTALPVIEQTVALLEKLPANHNDGQLEFMQSERERAAARVAGNDEWLLNSYREIRENEGLPLRVRVLYANLEAEICKRRGDAARERMCLEFVAARGGGLPAVPFAHARLAELSV